MSPLSPHTLHPRLLLPAGRDRIFRYVRCSDEPKVLRGHPNLPPIDFFTTLLVLL